MKKREQPNNDPWDRNSYETGSTRPPKDRGGAVAVLLVALLLVGSLCSALGILNVKLLQMLHSQTENAESVSLFDDDATDPTSHSDPITPSGSSVTLKLHAPPVHTPEPPENTDFPWLVEVHCGDRTGSGLIMTEDGYIITNAHLLTDSSITVTFYNGLQLPADLVGANGKLDVAMLHVQATGLTPAQFGDSAQVQEGDGLFLVGEELLTGIAGADGIPTDRPDAAVVMNHYGQIVAISAEAEGTPHFLMTEAMKPAVDKILSDALFRKAALCLTGCTVSDFDHRFYDLPYGVLVTQVEDAGCAEAAGIRIGDVITAVDGTEICSIDDLKQHISGYQAGQRIQITFYRPQDGKTVTEALILSEAEE